MLGLINPCKAECGLIPLMSAPPMRSSWRNTSNPTPSARPRIPDGRVARGRPSSTVSPNSYRLSTPPNALPPDRDILEGLHTTPLQTITIPLPGDEDEDIKITDYDFIGSYNWTNDATPTIIVPGSPPQWLNRSTPYNVQPDIGLMFRDQNGFRMPSAVLLPLVVAVNKKTEDEGNPPFDWSSIDFVTDRNGLRKLTRWIGQKEVKDFRIDMQLAGEKTVLFNRWEKCTREQFDGRTFGFNFEKESTTPAPGCKNGTGHHRIVTYDLSGLKMVVRFEVDACFPPPAKSYPRKSISSIDELAQSLSGVSLSSQPSSDQPSPSPKNGLTVVKGGSYVSASAVIELTTRSEARQKFYDWKEAYPQLFFSQTAHHFLAVHQRGRFIEVNKRKLSSPELQNVEQIIQPDLKLMRKALDKIKDLVVKYGERGRLTLVCSNGELKLYERKSLDSCLPHDFLELF